MSRALVCLEKPSALPCGFPVPTGPVISVRTWEVLSRQVIHTQGAEALAPKGDDRSDGPLRGITDFLPRVIPRSCPTLLCSESPFRLEAGHYGFGGLEQGDVLPCLDFRRRKGEVEHVETVDIIGRGLLTVFEEGEVAQVGGFVLLGSENQDLVAAEGANFP